MANVLLCALTGFGNDVIRAISNTTHKIKAVCTRKELGPYPYYKCDSIESIAKQYSIPIFYELPDKEWIKKQDVTGLVSTSYHKIIPKNLLDTVDFKINFHPSLLPKYRGASPIFWSIKNGEKFTGWTAHKITPIIDQGEIYDQVQMPIGIETQGELRQKLSELLQRFLMNFFSSLDYKLSNGKAQDEKMSSLYPRFTINEFGMIQPSLSEQQIIQHARALLPWPGISLGGEKVLTLEDLAARISNR